MELSKKKKNASFSNSINFLIVFCFGIAFLLIYLASVFLLLLSGEKTDAMFYAKVVVLFFAFLVIYIGSAVTVISKIRKMFRPLDKLAHGLLTDEIRMYGDSDDIGKLAENLKSEMSRLEDISRELDETKLNLDVAQSKAQMEQNSIESGLQRYNSFLLEMEKIREHLKTDFRKENRVYDELPLLQAGMNQCRNAIAESGELLEGASKEGRTLTADTRESLQATRDAFSVLNNMLEENSQHIESLFSEMTHLQSMVAEFGLVCTNLALDLSRSGGLRPAISSYVEEIKLVSEKMQEKTDAMAMYVIRALNAGKLAKDQSGFCMEQMEEGQENFERADMCLKEITESSSHLQLSMEKLSRELEQTLESMGTLQTIQVSKLKSLSELEQQQTKLKKWNKGMQKEINS